MNKELPALYWLWIPIIAMMIQIILEIALPGEILSRMQSENGPHELLQFFVLVMGFFVCLHYFFRCRNKTKLLNFWFGLAAVCCFYVAGEEISWGQHVFDWATTGYWSEVNDQNETNFHNITSWFDQKPRLILEVGIIGGTIILPYLQKRHWISIPQNLAILMPSAQLGVIALLIIIPKLIEKAFELFDIAVFSRISEVQELYMFYFVLLYLLSLLNRAASPKIS